MTETNLFQEAQEDLDRQRIEALTKRYGGLVMVAVVAIVLGTAALTGWQSWQTQKHQENTGALLHILEQQNADPAQQVKQLEDFAAAKPGTTPATLGLLQAAALETKQSHADKAIALYDRVAKDKTIDPALQQFAELMSVRSQMDTTTPADLQARLQPLTAPKAPWRMMAMELQGYLDLRAGDKDAARKVFTDLSQDATVPPTLSARAADMLRYLEP